MHLPESKQSTPHDRADAFGATLRARRIACGLSLEGLASRAGCSRSHVSSMETGARRPPSDDLLERLEEALRAPGLLRRAAQWESTPASIREELEAHRRITRLIKQGSLDALYASGKLQELVNELDGGGGATPPGVKPAHLPFEVPLINSVTAGYPAEFTDLGYPARHADEYVRVPDLEDPDAFAARVVGDSMEPSYREGDVVVFSPARAIAPGDDCFARLEPDHESTFKRVYFEEGEDGAEMIRLQPTNNAYPPRVVPRENVAGLYAAVFVMRKI